MNDEKDPSAVNLGRRGGKARLTKMTHEQRSEQAVGAVRKRWDKRKNHTETGVSVDKNDIKAGESHA